MSTIAAPTRPRKADADQATVDNRPVERIHYLDNLRALAMLLGVYLHSAFAYAKPSQSIWLATDPSGSTLVDASIWLIHLFRMSLFFFLAGYFAGQATQKKGVRTFLRNRAIRIVVPLVICYPFLLGAMTAVIVFAINYLETPTGLMGLIAQGAKSETAVPREASWTTMHLWFLYYLCMFTALSAMASCMRCHAFVDWARGWRRSICLVIAPVILLPAVLAAGIPLPAPESFVPTWWPFAFYGLFYVAGWRLKDLESVLESLSHLTLRITFVSLAAFPVYFATMPSLDLDRIVAGESSISPWDFPTATMLTAVLSVSLTLASLLLGRRFLNKRSAFLAFMADASYWIYLVHLPIAIFLQVLQLPLHWPVAVKLSVTLGGTLLFCMATYVVFVRYTLVGWILHGKRLFP